MLYRLDFTLRRDGLAEDSIAPRLSFDMLKPQAKGEDRVRDEVLKRAFFQLSSSGAPGLLY